MLQIESVGWQRVHPLGGFESAPIALALRIQRGYVQTRVRGRRRGSDIVGHRAIRLRNATMAPDQSVNPQDHRQTQSGRRQPPHSTPAPVRHGGLLRGLQVAREFAGVGRTQFAGIGQPPPQHPPCLIRQTDRARHRARLRALGLMDAASRQQLVDQQRQGKHVAAKGGFDGHRLHRTVRLHAGRARAKQHAARFPRLGGQAESQQFDHPLLSDENHFGIQMLVGKPAFATAVIQSAGNGSQPFQHGFERESVPALLAQPLRQAATVLVIHVFHLDERPAVGAMPPAIRAGDMRMVQFQGQFHPRLDPGQVTAQADQIRAQRSVVATGVPGASGGRQKNLDGAELFRRAIGRFRGRCHDPRQPDLPPTAQLAHQAKPALGWSDHHPGGQSFGVVLRGRQIGLRVGKLRGVRRRGRPILRARPGWIRREFLMARHPRLGWLAGATRFRR